MSVYLVLLGILLCLGLFFIISAIVRQFVDLAKKGKMTEGTDA